MPMIKAILEILDIPRAGKKEELVERLMTWLEAPKDSGRKVPKPKRKCMYLLWQTLLPSWALFKKSSFWQLSDYAKCGGMVIRALIKNAGEAAILNSFHKHLNFRCIIIELPHFIHCFSLAKSKEGGGKRKKKQKNVEKATEDAKEESEEEEEGTDEESESEGSAEEEVEEKVRVISSVKSFLASKTQMIFIPI